MEAEASLLPRCASWLAPELAGGPRAAAAQAGCPQADDAAGRGSRFQRKREASSDKGQRRDDQPQERPPLRRAPFSKALYAPRFRNSVGPLSSPYLPVAPPASRLGLSWVLPPRAEPHGLLGPLRRRRMLPEAWHCRHAVRRTPRLCGKQILFTEQIPPRSLSHPTLAAHLESGSAPPHCLARIRARPYE